MSMCVRARRSRRSAQVNAIFDTPPWTPGSVRDCLAVADALCSSSMFSFLSVFSSGQALREGARLWPLRRGPDSALRSCPPAKPGRPPYDSETVSGSTPGRLQVESGSTTPGRLRPELALIQPRINARSTKHRSEPGRCPSGAPERRPNGAFAVPGRRSGGGGHLRSNAAVVQGLPRRAPP